ncbi:MAG: cation:proton antiporter [Robiginitomaculum sp.]|nr:MAG: cation:proton antiporter [Robiginitomaculum sp.]
MVKSAFVLLIVLVIYWFTLSGYFDHTVLFVSGTVSVVLVVWLSARMKLLDGETTPYAHGKSLVYFAWLFKEIAKANMSVVKAVLNPDMEISPSVFKVDMKQSTDMGRTVFANSITLTPGTISVELEDGEILVHALLDELTGAQGFKEMGERSGWAVSDPMLAGPTPKVKKTRAKVVSKAASKTVSKMAGKGK